MKISHKVFGFFILLLSFACKKDKHDVVYMDCRTFTEEAIVNYTDPAGDGCAWTITIRKNPMPSPPPPLQVYSPNNLDTAFQHENLSVKLTYKFDGNGFYCGIANTKLETITILKIVKL